MRREFVNLDEYNYKYVARIDAECLASEKWSEEQFKAEIYDSSKFYVVCKVDGIVVGFGGYAQVLDEGNILNIAVVENYRKQGIATEILNIMIQNGIKNGINAFALEVRESNLSARLLYEKTGFKFVGVRKNFYSDKENACIYWLYT